jgi:hypothetical protein
MKTVFLKRSIPMVAFALLATAASLMAQQTNELVGSWSKQEGNVWKFMKNNAYKITAGHVVIEGTYSIKANELTLIDKTAKGVKFTCNKEQKGVYKFVVSKGTLRVLSVADSCAARKLAIPGMYKKL